MFFSKSSNLSGLLCNGLKRVDSVNANLEKFLNLYKNKFILVYEQEVVGSFDTYEVAAEEGIKTYGLNAGFLVHYVTETTIVNFVSSALL